MHGVAHPRAVRASSRVESVDEQTVLQLQPMNGKVGSSHPAAGRTANDVLLLPRAFVHDQSITNYNTGESCADEPEHACSER